MDSREQRIATLAATLKSSGIAKSDSQAKMMAEDMIGVEEHVQRDYEVEHTRANEYLRTAKNLGTPRQTIQPIPAPVVKQEVRQDSSRKIEPIADSENNSKVVSEYTDVNFGERTLNQATAQANKPFDHNTHNSALEAIKAQVGRIEKSRTEIDSDGLVPMSEPVTSARLSEIRVKDKPTFSEVDELIDVPKQVIPEQVTEEESMEESKEEPVIEEPMMGGIVDKENIVEIPKDESKLDAQKLIDMMEEDGKLEEHTREIKEKPKNVKPKEAYEENNIDLGNMFNFNKK